MGRTWCVPGQLVGALRSVGNRSRLGNRGGAGLGVNGHVRRPSAGSVSTGQASMGTSLGGTLKLTAGFGDEKPKVA